jgi:hypothetical protein
VTLRGGQRRNQRARVERQAEIGEERRGALAQPALPDEVPAEPGLPGKDVLCDGELLET